MWCASGAAVHARSSSTGSHAVRTTTVTVYCPHRNPPCIGHFHVYPCIRSTPLREYAAAIITPHRLCGAGLWSSESLWLWVRLAYRITRSVSRLAWVYCFSLIVRFWAELVTFVAGNLARVRTWGKGYMLEFVSHQLLLEAPFTLRLTMLLTADMMCARVCFLKELIRRKISSFAYTLCFFLLVMIGIILSLNVRALRLLLNKILLAEHPGKIREFVSAHRTLRT